jgi:hypothetical protein
VKNLNIWLHLVINILSTLLLTGSNAFMAAVSCPSRKEVDKPHRRGKFCMCGALVWGFEGGCEKEGVCGVDSGAEFGAFSSAVSSH